MLKMHHLTIPGYEQVVEAQDPEAGLHAFIAIHSTALGPSLGGVRMFPYRTKEEALEDALRLSKAMSYKSALAETGLGGGKSVIIGNPKTDKTRKLLHSFAKAIHSLKGKYIAAEDVGTTPEDMVIIHKKTPYVTALPLPASSGDPSRFTAFGIFKGMQAAAQFLWHSDDLTGKKIAIQGLGNVGSKLAHLLFWEGADLILTDLDTDKLKQAILKFGARPALPHEIMTLPCDILAPCALGAILNAETIPHLNCQAIAGSANNQLERQEDGIELMERHILLAPDNVINSGGIINVSCELDPQGYNPRAARDRTERIYDTLLKIFERAKREHKSPSDIADEIALYNIKHLISARLHPLKFG
jgi:leucine dehydrogenase